MGAAAKTMAGLTLALALVAGACSGGSNSAGPTQPAAQVGSVQGTVKETSGSAVPSAGLTLSATGRSSLTSTSGADGSFSFTSVPVGSWTLTVAPPTGFKADAQSSAAVTVAAGQTATVNLLLDRSGGTPQSGNVPVSIAGFAFVPADLTITAGSTVTWKNNDTVAHTATGDAGEFDSGNLANGASFAHTFNTKGTFTYHCAIHATMKATIVVQ